MTYLFQPRLETSRGLHTFECITSSTPSDICATCYLNELLGWFLIDKFHMPYQVKLF